MNTYLAKESWLCRKPAWKVQRSDCGSNSWDYLIFILKQLTTSYFNDIQRPERYEEKIMVEAIYHWCTSTVYTQDIKKETMLTVHNIWQAVIQVFNMNYYGKQLQITKNMRNRKNNTNNEFIEIITLSLLFLFSGWRFIITRTGTTASCILQRKRNSLNGEMQIIHKNG